MASLSFNQLPVAGEVQNGDFFVIENITGAKKLDYQNLIFGLDNVTFASTISGQSTDIVSLSTNLYSLSSQVYSEVNTLENLLNTTVQTATANFLNILYPINCIMYTTNNVNPGLYIYNTSWDQVSQGLFVAGVGNGVDKNGVGLTVGEENAAELVVVEEEVELNNTKYNIPKIIIPKIINGNQLLSSVGCCCCKSATVLISSFKGIKSGNCCDSSLNVTEHGSSDFNRINQF